LLPFHEPDRLVVVQSSGTTAGSEDRIGMDELNEWRVAMPAFTGLAAAGGSRRQAVRLDFTASMSTIVVTANFFTTLGREAMAGRVFTAQDARGSNAVVLGTRGWQRAFDARPDLVGKTVLIDNEPHTVVGIVQTDDSCGPEADLFLPIDDSAATARSGATTFYSVIGRLAPGATHEVALAQAQAVVDRRGRGYAGLAASPTRNKSNSETCLPIAGMTTESPPATPATSAAPTAARLACIRMRPLGRRWSGCGRC
jgi:hypothetical protein